MPERVSEEEGDIAFVQVEERRKSTQKPEWAEVQMVSGYGREDMKLE